MKIRRGWEMRFRSYGLGLYTGVITATITQMGALPWWVPFAMGAIGITLIVGGEIGAAWQRERRKKGGQ